MTTRKSIVLRMIWSIGLIILFITLTDFIEFWNIPPLSHALFLKNRTAYENMIYEFHLCKDDCDEGWFCTDESWIWPSGCQYYWKSKNLENLQGSLHIYNTLVTPTETFFYLRDIYGHETPLQYVYKYPEENYNASIVYTWNIFLTGNRFTREIDISSEPLVDSTFLLENLEKYDDFIEAVSSPNYKNCLHPRAEERCTDERKKIQKFKRELLLSDIIYADDYVGVYIGSEEGSSNDYYARSSLMLKYVTDRESRNERTQRAKEVSDYRTYIDRLDGTWVYPERSKREGVLRPLLKAIHFLRWKE